MVVAKCIKKEVGAKGEKLYSLKDLEGNTKRVTGKQLKDAMASGKIVITNMEITKSGALKEKTLSKEEEVLANIYEVLYVYNNGMDDEYEDDEDSYFAAPEYCIDAIEEKIERYFKHCRAV